jgi:hypothetical protein
MVNLSGHTARALEMRNLQSLRRDGNLAIGGKTGPADPVAEGLSGLESGNDENRGLNAEHRDLFDERARLGPSGQNPLLVLRSNG